MKTKKAKKCKNRQRLNRKKQTILQTHRKKKPASPAAYSTPTSAESVTPSHAHTPNTHSGKAEGFLINLFTAIAISLNKKWFLVKKMSLQNVFTNSTTHGNGDLSPPTPA